MYLFSTEAGSAFIVAAEAHSTAMANIKTVENKYIIFFITFNLNADLTNCATKVFVILNKF